MSFLQVLALPLLLALPGYACLRMFLRPSGAALLLSIPLSVPFTSIAAFLLAVAGVFSLGALAGAVLLISGILWLFPARGTKSFLQAMDFRFAAVAAALLAATMWYAAPPFEYYFGGRDPGIYVVNGIRVAKTGALSAEDPLVTHMEEKYRTLFFSEKQPIRYMGFQMEKDRDGFVVANFFHLYPVWLAIFYTLFGVHGMLYATPFLACCLLFFLAWLIRLVQGEAEAVGSILLLGANPIFLWFARFPNSEWLAGALIFAGIVFLEGYRRTSQTRAGVLGAIFLGLAFWARVDAGLLGVALFIFLAIRWMSGEGTLKDAWLLVVFAAVAAVNMAHVMNTNPDYVMGTYYNLRFKTYKVVAVLAILGAAVMTAAYLGRRYKVLQYPWLGKALALGLGVLLGYAYCVRPFYPPENVGSPNAGAFLALGWYFTHPVVILALVGVVWYALSFRSIQWVLFSAALFYSMLYFYRIRADAEHFWMLRRYLTMICPALVFFALYAVRRLLQLASWIRPRASALLILASALCAGWFVYDSRDIYKHREYGGSFNFMKGLADRLRPEDLLILGSRDANDLHIVGPMLSFYFEKNVVQLRSGTPELPLLADFLKSWKGKVYFAGAGNSNLASDRFSLVPLEEVVFTTPVFDEIYHERPHNALSKIFQIGWYGVADKPARNPFFVDIGKYDDGSITNFHLKEEYSGVDYRWTNGRGHVFFPPSAAPPRSVQIRMNPGPWVPGMERVHVKLIANGSLLVDLVLRNGYNTYEVPVPAAVQALLTGVPVDVEIQSKNWIPKRVLNLPDFRRVGVIVDWVKLVHE